MEKHPFFKRSLVILLILSLFGPFLAGRGPRMLAEESPRFTFQALPGDKAVLTRYDGNQTDLVIPSQYEGFTFTRIGPYAFRWQDRMKSVTIPSSIEEIGEAAFYGCTSLTSVSMPDPLPVLGENVFARCDSLKHQDYMGKFVIDDADSYYRNTGEIRHVLSFHENGYPRTLFVYLDPRVEPEWQGAYLDYPYPLRVIDALSDERLFDIYSGVNERDEFDRVENLSPRFFIEGTVITHLVLMEEYQYLAWYRELHPLGMTPETFDLHRYHAYYRQLYESLVPPEQRFPRKQITPRFREDSLIPKGRDAEPVPEGTVPVLVLLRKSQDDWLDSKYVCMFAEPRENSGKEGQTVWHELFSGVPLYTVNEEWQPVPVSLEYFKSLAPGYELSIATPAIGSPPPMDPPYSILTAGELPLTIDSMFGAWKFRRPYYDSEALFFLKGFINQAKTIGDLRRVYETLPSNFWYIQPAKAPLDYSDRIPDPPDEATHYVSNLKEFKEALAKAKNDETIVLLGDIPVFFDSFEIKDKRVNIRGLTGTRPGLVFAEEMLLPGLELNESKPSLFILRNAKVDFENIRLDMSGEMDCFFVYEGSEVRLGPGTQISGFETVMVNVDTAPSRLIVDGARVTHNETIVRRAGVESNLHFHMIDGEIAYNTGYNAMFQIGSYNGTSKKNSSFVMDGGSIHNNRSDREVIIEMLDAKGLEINGGKFYENAVARGAPIHLTHTKAVINGGEMYRNVGEKGGVFIIGETSGMILTKKGEASLVMNGGFIYDNYTIEIFRSANAIMLSPYDRQKASFTMKGGEIRMAADKEDTYPLVLAYGKGATATISGGTIDIAGVEKIDGGKVVNRLKK